MEGREGRWREGRGGGGRGGEVVGGEQSGGRGGGGGGREGVDVSMLVEVGKVYFVPGVGCHGDGSGQLLSFFDGEAVVNVEDSLLPVGVACVWGCGRFIHA